MKPKDAVVFLSGAIEAEPDGRKKRGDGPRRCRAKLCGSGIDAAGREGCGSEGDRREDGMAG